MTFAPPSYSMTLRVRVGCIALAITACAGHPLEANSGADIGQADGGDPDDVGSTTGSAAEGPSDDDGVVTTLDATGTTGEGRPGSDSSDGVASSGDEVGSGGDDDGDTGVAGACHPILHEVANDVPMADDGLEWVELYNPCDDAIALDGYSLAWGGPAYESGLQLVGSIAAGGCFVVGGPLSSPDNGEPVFDQAVDFDTDLQNSGPAADGLALYAVPLDALDPTAQVPVDALIYGSANTNALVDEHGVVSEPDAPDVDDEHGYARAAARLDAAWVPSTVRSPGSCPNPG